MRHLEISFNDLKVATNGFADDALIGRGGFGNVYKGVSKKHGCIAVKRLDRTNGQGDNEFKTEISLLSKYRHKNIVSLLGFCDEHDEKILVYRYESNGSLDKHLNNKDITWIQRLKICLDAGCGLQYVHDNVESHFRIFHRDIKSGNILLDKDLEAKISDFGLSKVRSTYSQSSFVISNACGTIAYIDPNYLKDGYLSQKCDVYSFGVVLWEVLCGREAPSSYKNGRHPLTILAEKHYIRQTLDSIIPSYLRKQMNPNSLRTFSNIAYQCLRNGEERPTMKQVVEQLRKALHYQQKAEEEAIDSRMPPPSKEVVLSVFLHCQGCARKVRRCLKRFEGVEDVVTDCKNHKVIVKGEKADSLKVIERVEKASHSKVELLSPVPKQPELDQEELSKQEDKIYEVPDPQMITVTLKVNMHCEACVRDIKKCVKMMKGVETVVPDLDNSLVVVTGTFLAEELLDYVHNKTGKKIMIVKQEASPEKAYKDEDEQKGW